MRIWHSLFHHVVVLGVVSAFLSPLLCVYPKQVNGDETDEHYASECPAQQQNERCWTPSEYTYSHYDVAGRDLTKYRGGEDIEPYGLYEDFYIGDLITGSEGWWDLIHYKNRVRINPTLSFYTDKVARKRWLPTKGYAQPEVYFLKYRKELTTTQELRDENEALLKVLGSMNATNFVAKPSHKSFSDGTWLVANAGNGTSRVSQVARSLNEEINDDALKHKVAASLAQSLHETDREESSWIMRNVKPGLVVEELWTHPFHDDTPPLEFKLFCIWGRVWVSSFGEVQGQSLQYHAWVYRDGTTVPGSGYRSIPDWINYLHMVDIAEQLSANKDMMRIDMFVGAAGTVEPGASKEERLSAVKYGINEVEMAPKTRFFECGHLDGCDSALSLEGARLWIAGYKIGNYKVVPNTEIPREWVESGGYYPDMETPEARAKAGRAQNYEVGQQLTPKSVGYYPDMEIPEEKAKARRKRNYEVDQQLTPKQTSSGLWFATNRGWSDTWEDISNMLTRWVQADGTKRSKPFNDATQETAFTYVDVGPKRDRGLELDHASIFARVFQVVDRKITNKFCDKVLFQLATKEVGAEGDLVPRDFFTTEEALQEFSQDEVEIVFIKDRNGTLGQGISIVSLEDLPNTNIRPRALIQEGLTKSLALMNGAKVVLRAYFVIMSGRLYCHHITFIDFQDHPFDPKNTSKSIHLSHAGGTGHLDLRLPRRTPEHVDGSEVIWRECKDFQVESIVNGTKWMDGLLEAGRKAGPLLEPIVRATRNDSLHFTLLGVDLIPLEDGSFKLLEVNSYPSFRRSDVMVDIILRALHMEKYNPDLETRLVEAWKLPDEL